MTNVSLLPGPGLWRPHRGHKRRHPMETIAPGPLMTALPVQFSTEIGWRSKAARSRMLKNPSYSGITRNLDSCEPSASSLTELWGTPNCGKGQPMRRWDWPRRIPSRFGMCESDGIPNHEIAAKRRSRRRAVSSAGNSPVRELTRSSFVLHWHVPRKPKKPRSTLTKSQTT